MSTQDDSQAAFDAAFAEATSDAPATPAAAPAEPAIPAVAAAEPAAVAAEPAAPAEPVVEPAAEPAAVAAEPAAVAAEPAAAAPEPTPAPAPAQPGLTAEAIAQAMAEFQAKQPPAPAPEPPKTEPKLDDFITADEKALLAEYDKEWGEVSRAEQIRTKAAVQFALAQYDAQVTAKLAPIYEQIRSSNTVSHKSAIHVAHPDVEQIAPELQKWVAENSSAMLRREGTRVIQSGTADEVIDLIATFKSATGRTGAGPASTVASPAAQEPAAPAAPAPAAPVPAPSAKAAVATAAVTAGQRTGIPQAKDKDDFALAWDEAVAAT